MILWTNKVSCNPFLAEAQSTASVISGRLAGDNERL